MVHHEFHARRDDGLHHPRHLLDQRCRVDRLQVLAGRVAAELEHLGHQFPRPLAGRHHRGQIVCDAFGAFRRQYGLRQRDIPQNARQNIVEVVRDTARQLTQRIHLLGLLEFPLQTLAFVSRAGPVGQVVEGAD